MTESTPLPSNAIILVHYIAPLELTHAQRHIQDIRTHPEPSSSASQDDNLRWQIKNKYYEAEVGFKLVQAGEIGEDEPAVIVLAQRSQTPETSLKTLLQSLADRATEFEVALLVTLPIASSTEVDEAAWEDLAIDHGFEWVDVVPGDDEVQEKASPGEEGGLRRVVAALHAHMWEGMEAVERNGDGNGKRIRAEEEDVDDEGALTGRKGLLHDDDNDDEELSSLGAPPLPEPRPFVPIQLEFPSTFLPSLKRASDASPASASTPFEDDFAPFVPALSPSETAFPPLPDLPSSTSSNNTSSHLYRHPELAFPDTDDLASSIPAHDTNDDEDEDEDEALQGDEDLSDLFAKLASVRDQNRAEGVDLEARRDAAERVMQGLFGGLQ